MHIHTQSQRLYRYAVTVLIQPRKNQRWIQMLYSLPPLHREARPRAQAASHREHAAGPAPAMCRTITPKEIASVPSSNAGIHAGQHKKGQSGRSAQLLMLVESPRRVGISYADLLQAVAAQHDPGVGVRVGRRGGLVVVVSLLGGVGVQKGPFVLEFRPLRPA